MASASILELSETISKHSKIVQDYHTRMGLSPISFDDDHSRHAYPEEVTHSKECILNASTDLRALMLGPVRILQNVGETSSAMSIHVISHYKVAHKLPIDQELSFSQLADECGMPKSHLRRILRYAMTQRIFQELSPGMVKHTAASRALAQVPLMNQWLEMVSEEIRPAATGVVAAMEKWPESQEPNEAGFNIANNTSLSCYAEFEKTPARAKRFADAMNLFQLAPGFAPGKFVDNYDFASLNRGVFVDIGGSHGSISIEIAKKHPSMKCIVQDLPEVVEAGRKAVVVDGVTFMAHDFFTKQPVEDADVYYLRWILHNWSDKYAMMILRNLIPALKKGAKVVVSDICLPVPGQLHPEVERSMRMYDLSMMQLQNGKERDPDDWKQLFAETDERFVFESVKQPPGSLLAIIEARWDGEKA